MTESMNDILNSLMIGRTRSESIDSSDIFQTADCDSRNLINQSLDRLVLSEQLDGVGLKNSVLFFDLFKEGLHLVEVQLLHVLCVRTFRYTLLVVTEKVEDALGERMGNVGFTGFTEIRVSLNRITKNNCNLQL